MKKIGTTIFLITMMFVINSFADGDMPAGGKTCQQNQTCLVSNNDDNENAKDFSLYFLWLKIRDDLRIVF